MKAYIVFFVLGLLSVTTCSDKSSMSQCNIYQTNLDVSHELFTNQLNDAEHYYLLGALEKDKRDFRTSEITIERAVVGDEKKWISFSEKIPGKCQAVCQTEKYIYLISKQQYQERQDPKYSKHKLYRISKEDGKVSELYEWDKGNSFVKSIYFTSKDRGVVLFRPSGNPLDYQILRTENGGTKWSLENINKPIREVKMLNNNLYFLSYKRNDKTDWIYSIEKKSNEFDSLQFDLNITDFAVSENGDYWLLGKDNDRTVFQQYKDGKISEIKTFSEDAEFSPNQLYKYNDVVVVLASEIDKSMLGGFGGTKPAMYLSKDNGLTWSNHPLDEALYLKPVSFYKDERMTAYIGRGKVLSCILKK
ncbi:hypothetical protein NMK71_01480 [Weeksellaceae bacterium KMM 9713]|uniref:Uncharacterized protein n=1 Tax=Profundicola chukchiensis TaxID=2961959 RepID=A0A9X4RVT4_9FLAO|nr:hypothetical protein [Profundicola chukchiensis]MDG4945072.1 hypothetical protein [Profundicola chukchiensis]